MKIGRIWTTFKFYLLRQLVCSPLSTFLLSKSNMVVFTLNGLRLVSLHFIFINFRFGYSQPPMEKFWFFAYCTVTYFSHYPLRIFQHLLFFQQIWRTLPWWMGKETELLEINVSRYQWLTYKQHLRRSSSKINACFAFRRNVVVLESSATTAPGRFHA